MSVSSVLLLGWPVLCARLDHRFVVTSMWHFGEEGEDQGEREYGCGCHSVCVGRVIRAEYC